MTSRSECGAYGTADVQQVIWSPPAIYGGVVVADQMHIQLGGDLGIEVDEELFELDCTVAAVDRSINLAGGQSSAANSLVMPWRT